MNKKNKNKVTNTDLKVCSLDDILTECYGKKGTKKRKKADKMIKKLSRTLIARNLQKEKKERKK